VWTGQRQGDAAQFVNQSVAADKPVLLWCEPVAGRVRRPGFGLLNPAGMSPLPAATLAEARLFYEDGLLHIAAGPDGWRFAAWREGCHDQPPPWSPPDDRSAAPMADQAEQAKGCTVQGTRTQRTILLNHAADTRGLDVTPVGACVTAVEYYESGILRWWRLTNHG
jgi:hypothetical protein